MTLTKEQIKALIADKVQYSISCMPEDTGIRGNVMASGSSAVDKEVEDMIVADLESGNEWAWCIVKVAAKLLHIDCVSYDYLGGCSYKSEADFIANSGQYEDMKEQALSELVDAIHGNLEAYAALGLIA